MNCMQEPIKSGDTCLVISGSFGDKSPNVGKRVTVINLVGEHSEFGRIWRCGGNQLTTEFGAVGNESQFAQSWLKKLPPETPKSRERQKELSI